jgi:hypothetical protein
VTSSTTDPNGNARDGNVPSGDAPSRHAPDGNALDGNALEGLASDVRVPPGPGPVDAVRALTSCRRPYLIGVRHHSPALAVAVPALLDAAAPEVLLVELPTELGEWLPWLAHEDTQAPVALSGADRDGGRLAFYPFADFSPELAAIRWAARHGVPVVPCDLPLALRGDHGGGAERPAPLAAALRAGMTGRDGEDMWDRVVEAAAPGQSPESVRRAGLAVGWALRHDAGDDVDPFDLRREAWMRRTLTDVGDRPVAAVVGSFHAGALLPGPATGSEDVEPPGDDRIVTALVPYGFAQLDERSGYPAGIRDPEWQQAVFEAAGDPLALEHRATEVIVRVCKGLRARGHPAGPAEAREAVRMAVDLARLRGLPAPGRGELVEAMQTVLTQAEPVGRGRVVALAAGEVLVGSRTGVLADDTPRSGLAPSVEAELAELRLPGPAEWDKQVNLRLDGFRSTLDGRRLLALHRLGVLGVPYASATPGTGIGAADPLTARWSVRWTASTSATLPAAGLWGVTLAQAAAGRLRAERRHQAEAGGPTADEVLQGARAAAECGLPDLVGDRLTDMATLLPATGTLVELLAALDLLDRLRAGHLPGVPADLARRHTDLVGALEGAAVAALAGLAGSDDLADARAVVALGQRTGRAGGVRLGSTLRTIARNGSPLMQGAACATRVLLDLDRPADLGTLCTSWLDAAGTPESRKDLRRRLSGVLVAAAGLLETPDALDPLLDRVDSLPDKDFLDRLPALRGAFTVVGPAARDRVLAAVRERTGESVDAGNNVDPELVAQWLVAERAGAAALSAHHLDRTGPQPAAAPDSTPLPRESVPPDATSELPSALRWRLVLARSGDRPAGGGRYAAALDELYGRDRGEGTGSGSATGAGRETPFPGAREWSTELEALFGADVREEVLAAAADSGRLDAVLELDPDSVRPSVDLLRDVLALAGGLPESALARLRPLVARLVAELAAKLNTRLRPALTGLRLPRPSRRPGGRLDMARTVRANLATARRGPDGRVRVIPEHPVFGTRAKRTNDWRLVLVVDVSGSMESSTIWSALTAAILAGVPSLTTHFVTFSTEVVDLTDHVRDPLSLLLEVRVGGGTHIAAGLRYARSLVTVPERTLVVVVSDFEEGGPQGELLAQARELVDAGVKVLGCASLDDTGTARYSTATAGALVAAGMPVAALSPQGLAAWVGDQLR